MTVKSIAKQINQLNIEISNSTCFEDLHKAYRKRYSFQSVVLEEFFRNYYTKEIENQLMDMFDYKIVLSKLSEFNMNYCDLFRN